MPVITVREALRQALHDAMQDERVFIIGEDIGHYGSTYGVTAGFLEQYGPERIRDAPIAESGIVGIAIGAAMVGMRPIAEIMSVNFSLRRSLRHTGRSHRTHGAGAVNTQVRRWQPCSGKGDSRGKQTSQ